MGADEQGTLERLKTLRRELVDPKLAEHNGRIVKTTGDGMLFEFSERGRCGPLRGRGAAGDARAERWPRGGGPHRIAHRHQSRRRDRRGRRPLRDGVNIAARIEALADAGGVFVSNTVQDHVRDRLPFVFEDMGGQALKNITRPVRVYRVRPERPLPSPPPQTGEESAHSARVGAAEPPLPLPAKPSVAVLPFANMSGDPDQEYFADGMVEEIITALSRIRWLFVIARNSTFTYKGQVIEVKQVSRELGVRYVLGTKSSRPGADHRAADRCAQRRASLGRPLRRLARRRLRAAGQGGAQHRRRNRADFAGRGDALRGRSADERFDSLRSLFCARARLLRHTSGNTSLVRSTCLAKRLPANRATVPLSPWRRPTGSTSKTTIGSMTERRRKTAARRLILPARPWASPPTTRVSSAAPPWCSGVSARVSIPLWR